MTMHDEILRTIALPYRLPDEGVHSKTPSIVDTGALFCMLDQGRSHYLVQRLLDKSRHLYHAGSLHVTEELDPEIEVLFVTGDVQSTVEIEVPYIYIRGALVTPGVAAHHLAVGGNVWCEDGLHVEGEMRGWGSMRVGELKVQASCHIEKWLTVDRTLFVGQSLSVNGRCHIKEDAVVGERLDALELVFIKHIKVGGDIKVRGPVAGNGNVEGGADLCCRGPLNVYGDVVVKGIVSSLYGGIIVGDLYCDRTADGDVYRLKVCHMGGKA